MFNLAFSLALLPLNCRPADEWVHDILASQPATAVLSKIPRASLSRAPVSQHISHGIEPKDLDNNITIVPLDFKPATDAAHDVSDLLETGKSEDAFSFISSFLEAHSELREYLASSVMDCELLTGRYEEAYRDCVTFIATHTGPRSAIGEDYYLRLALAAAGRGQVFPGQTEYCVKWFRQHYEESWAGDKDPGALPKQEGPREAMIISSLALAVSTPSSQAYLENALKLDPGTDVAGHMLVQYDQLQGRYSDLRRIARSMTDHVQDAGSLAFYRDQTAAVAGLADRLKPRQSSATP